MNIEEILVNKHGCLLSIATLAQVLDRSPEGLRISLRSTNTSEWAQRVNATRLRIGRRVYFRTSEIASILAGK
jgi:hypothetical protein